MLTHTYLVDLVEAASLPAFSLICLFNCSISFLHTKQICYWYARFDNFMLTLKMIDSSVIHREFWNKQDCNYSYIRGQNRDLLLPYSLEMYSKFLSLLRQMLWLARKWPMIDLFLHKHLCRNFWGKTDHCKNLESLEIFLPWNFLIHGI